MLGLFWPDDFWLGGGRGRPSEGNCLGKSKWELVCGEGKVEVRGDASELLLAPCQLDMEVVRSASSSSDILSGLLFLCSPPSVAGLAISPLGTRT